MRLTTGGALLVHAAGALGLPTAVSAGYGIFALATALLLLLGLWTPAAGVLAALAAAWHGLSVGAEPDADMLLGIMGIALALLGPGAWSLDARLFGWKRFEIQNGTTTTPDAPSGNPDNDGPCD